MTIDLRQELKEFRVWLEQRIARVIEERAKQAKPKPISGIIAMFCYVQDGWIAVDFDTSKHFEFDGDVSASAWRQLLQRPEWQTFAESDGPVELTFLKADGSLSTRLADQADDDFFASHFGQMIADALLSAWDDGLFSKLRLKSGCTVMVDNFDGNWGWVAVEMDGRLVPE